jgi:hypothetical protein
MDRQRLEHLRARLKASSPAEVSRRCGDLRPGARGVSRTNLIAIRDGKTDSPGILCIELIEAALDSIEAPTAQEVAS